MKKLAFTLIAFIGFIYANGVFADTNDYVKFMENGKYGVENSQGNVILPPEFDFITFTEFNGQNYIYAKSNGINKLYYSDGSPVPEEELYSVYIDEATLELAKDIKPIFKQQFIQKKAKYNTLVSTDSEKVQQEENID